jgi:hypothetical protein
MPNKTSTHSSEQASSARKPQHGALASDHQSQQGNAAGALDRALNAPTNILVPADILALQHTAGNRAVAQLLSERVRQSPQGRLTIQTKLTVGAADDPYEREADRVAATIMQPSESSAPHIQRQPVEEDEEKMVQRKPLASSITPLVQRQEMPEKEDDEERPIQLSSDGGSASVEPNVEAGIERARANGQPLPDDLRNLMEQSFGADFSPVRVHTDSESDSFNRSLNARAFTTGYDLFFKRGEYNPGSSEGQRVIAHELTHVVQQRGVSRLRVKPGAEEKTKREAGESDANGEKSASVRGETCKQNIAMKRQDIPLIQRLNADEKKEIKTFKNVEANKQAKQELEEKKQQSKKTLEEIAELDEKLVLQDRYLSQLRLKQFVAANHPSAQAIWKRNYLLIKEFLYAYKKGLHNREQNVADVAEAVGATVSEKPAAEEAVASVKMKVHEKAVKTAQANPKEFWKIGSGGGDKRSAPAPYTNKVQHHHMYGVYTWNVLHTPWTADGTVKVLGEVDFHMDKAMSKQEKLKVEEVCALKDGKGFKEVTTNKLKLDVAEVKEEKKQ